jgi:predicted Zn finger-like uncharacterized protein
MIRIMKIICPSCSSSYTIKASPEEASGRKVRCAQCEHIWTLNLKLQNKSGSGQKLQQKKPSETHSVMNGHKETPEDRLSGRTMDQLYKKDKARKNTKPNIMAGFLSSLPKKVPLLATLVLAFLIVSGILLRHSIVYYVPDLAGLYEKAGLPVNVVGLSFVDVTLKREGEGGRELVVEGAVTNITDQDKTIPPINVMLLSDQNVELYVLPALVSEASVGPGQQTAFKAEIKKPPELATHVRVVFQ